MSERGVTTGPDLTNQLIGVLLRFRKEVVAITADIEGMFLQVRIPEDQRSYLRFLWWPNGDIDRKPEEYEMCSHTFGAICSPSCTNFALIRTAMDNRENIGDDAADSLLRDFYVDDLLKSIKGTEEAIVLIPRLRKMCQAGGFNLTKFISNSPDVVESIPPENRAPSIKEYEMSRKLPVERALGVSWCVESDKLGFRICLQDTPVTRRGILSTISSIYDVFGIASPFMLKGRKILQEITSGKHSWDDPVSDEHVVKWTE